MSEIDFEKEQKEVLKAYTAMLRAAKHAKKDAVTKKRIRKAFNVALEAHKNDRRKISHKKMISHHIDTCLLINRAKHVYKYYLIFILDMARSSGFGSINSDCRPFRTRSLCAYHKC